MGEPKWEGKVSVEVGGVGAEEAWSVIQDFCNLHKWIPIDTCYQVEGVLGQPGLIRYCASNVEDATAIKWAKEKLLSIDPIQRCLSYEVLDNNVGFKSYVATLKVLPINGGSCQIEWGFVSDPVEGWSFQDLNDYIHSSLLFMANRIQYAAANIYNVEGEHRPIVKNINYGIQDNDAD
ncbi:hypothetical protein RJT34_10097 [Clitoria ternatea]|uniref:Lachrymatory factor synthase n=1 Tax=Clitoria ternatea TaxID=43366 RepID=A0AAN9K6D0_CLITE